MAGNKPTQGKSRREFLSWILMGGALAASYGLLASYAGRFLWPSKKPARFRPVFVATKDKIIPGKPLAWIAPNGQTVMINNIDGQMLALSNVCPHLGCKVHWEGQNNRFYCPCHSGTFDKNGTATGGPPAAEGKNLQRYDLTTEGNAVYLQWEEA